MSIEAVTTYIGIYFVCTVFAVLIRAQLGEYEEPVETVKGAMLVGVLWPAILIGYPFYALVKYIAYRLSERRKRLAQTETHHIELLSPEEEILQIEQREQALHEELKSLEQKKADATRRLGPYPYRPLLPVKS